MYIYNKVYVALAAMVAFCLQATAQQKIENPKIDYSGAPKEVRIGGIAVSGVQGYDDFVLTSISGLSVGQTITLPGSEVTNAVKRYWKHGMFSEVSIAVDSIVGNEAFLHIHLNMRPRISVINYVGMKKSEREDLEKKIGIMKGGQLTPHMLDRAKLVVKRYFDDKGFKNADIEINRRDDVANKNQLILDVIVDKKEKIKVRNIIIEGNNNISDKKLKGNLFKKGAFAKTHEAGKLSNLFKSKKFTPENWESDKKNLINKYNEYGYRDAVILKDSVWNVDDKHVNVYVKVDEGKKYYVRNITWVGNTVYSTDYLSRLLDFEKGDVYNQKLLSKRLTEDEDAVGNVYWNNGYLFYNLQPTEVNIVGDSIDLEMRIFEGQQARINHVRINGNDRLYENVVRRELRTKPGDLFSKEALLRSQRELASMGHFDPEAVVPDPKPNYEDGTVDINWNLKQKSNDQVELSLGWGQTGIIGRVGLKFTNWSMRNLFRKNKEHRGILPIGDGETLSLGVQTNGRYYQSYNVSYSTGILQQVHLALGQLLQQWYDEQLLEQLLWQRQQLLQQLRELLRPRQVYPYARTERGMGKAPALARRLLHTLAAAGLHAIHDEELELSDDYQRSIEQPQPEHLAEPYVERQPALPAPRFGVLGIADAHSAMVEVGRKGLRASGHRPQLGKLSERDEREVPLGGVPQVEVPLEDLHRTDQRTALSGADDACGVRTPRLVQQVQEVAFRDLLCGWRRHERHLLRLL